MTTQEYKQRRSELQDEQRHNLNQMIQNFHQSVLSLNNELISSYTKKWSKLIGKRVSVAKNSQIEPVEIIYSEVRTAPHMNCDGTGIIVGKDPSTQEEVQIEGFVFGEGKLKEFK